MSLPVRCLVVDTETKAEQVNDSTVRANLWFGWYAYFRRHRRGKWSDEDYSRFETVDEFWDVVEQLTPDKTKLHIFAHNVSFDIQVLDGFAKMEERGWKLSLCIIEEPPTIISWKKEGKQVVFLDTLNWFLMSLENLGVEIGETKLDFPSYDESKETWDTYCKRDVRVLVKAIQLWLSRCKEWDMGGFRMTIASQALAAFRHRFMEHRIFIDDNEEAVSLARDSYYGGRTECFYIGDIKEHVTVLDVNSMYPHVMQSLEFPRWLEAVETEPSVYDVERALKRYSVVASVALDTDQPVYPYRKDGKLVFPVGRFQTTLAEAELNYALENGHICSINQAAFYSRAAIFKPYVDFFYALRQEAKRIGDTVTNLHVKILLNSLYGKFGQRGFVYEAAGTQEISKVGVWKVYDLDTGETKYYRAIGGEIFELKKDGESKDSFPAISSCVTSAARLHLWQLIQKAGRENVLYCDTDSLLVNDTGLERLTDEIDELKLGALAVEYEATTGVIRGAKDYLVGEKGRVKGIKTSAVQIAPNTFEQEHFRKIKGGLRIGNISEQIIVKVVKRLSRKYDKGQVLDSGLVIPLTISP
tara:strand:+ start:1985 stop:3739 length:1755 start_codon:yes stop_codon:yes gene_type:complete